MSLASIFRLDGRTALVTGASGALGARFAEVLLDAGATVIGTGRRADGDALRGLADRYPGRFLARALDVTADKASINSIECLIASLADASELPDVLVNNAGIAASTLALATPEDAWRDIVATNLDGPRRLALRWAGERVERGLGGNLVNVCSILAARTMPGTAPYASAKAGLVHLSRALALEWARHDIRVNVLSPGYVETPLNEGFFASDAGRKLVGRIPQRRLAAREDLDGALLLLCSDASRHMTGSEIVVDGGHSVAGP